MCIPAPEACLGIFFCLNGVPRYVCTMCVHTCIITTYILVYVCSEMPTSEDYVRRDASWVAVFEAQSLGIYCIRVRPSKSFSPNQLRNLRVQVPKCESMRTPTPSQASYLGPNISTFGSSGNPDLIAGNPASRNHKSSS